MRMDRPVALLVAIACASSAIAAEDANPVYVKGIEVVPRANLTADDGTLRLHPKAMLGTGYNSNIFAESDGSDVELIPRIVAPRVVVQIGMTLARRACNKNVYRTDTR